MKKVLFSFLLALVMLPVFMGASSCSIVHTHDYNYMGNCKVCSHCVCETLKFDQTTYTYSSKVRSVEPNTKYYFKFSGHRENNIDFLLDNESIYFDRLEVYDGSSVWPDLASAKEYNSQTYTLTKNFVDTTTYYLVITFRQSGNIKLTLQGTIYSN